MKIQKWLISIALSLICTQVFGTIDCTRPVARVWSGYDNNRVYVVYSDGYADAGMQLSDVNNSEQIINRTLSVILAGHLAGRSMSFRYSSGFDDSAPSCTPTAQQRLIGAWIN